MQDFDARNYLDFLSSCGDEQIDLGLAAVAMSCALHPGRSALRYVNHLSGLVGDVQSRFEALREESAQDDAGTRLAALKYVLCDMYDYHASADGVEPLEAADPVRVIDERRGYAAVVCLLYMHVARSMRWEIEGLRFPKYFLCRIEAGGQRLIFDAAQGCRLMEAQDLRALVKEKVGAEAELSSSYLEPVGDRALLIHIFNKIKARQIEMGDYAGALETLSVMRRCDPEEYRLWLDSGVLYVKTGQVEEAQRDLSAFVDVAPAGRDRQDALLLLDEIRRLEK